MFSANLLAIEASGSSSVGASDFHELQLLQTLTGHRDGVDPLAWSTDCRYLASAGEDHVVRIWG
jgi:COMPASS component SWD3